MPDLTNPKIIWVKGLLFLGMGLAASVLLLLEAPNLRVAVLLIVAAWGFCRFYYFAFYVIQHYVDDQYKFSGIYSFLRYMLRRKKRETPVLRANNERRC